MKIIIIGVLLCMLLYPQANAEIILEIEGDPITAFKKAKRDAAAGDTESQYRLGRMYSQGLIIQRKPKQALLWLEKAAKRDHREALYFLGLMYLYGNEQLLIDYEKGVDYLTRSAKLGLPEAETKLVSIRRYPEQKSPEIISGK